MKKTNLRIKENITLQDKINVVESIVEDYFRGGKYTPYFAPISKIVSIATYFIEGYELEDGDNLYTICMTDDDMKKAVEMIDGRAETECSGNITRENIARLADIGVNYVSSGALTHSAPILDLSLKNLKIID